MKKNQYWHKSQIILSRLLSTFFSFPFWILTILGNGLIMTMAFGLFFLEGPEGYLGHNPSINNYFDTVWWAFSTVTTVGYGDVVPTTHGGKIFGIFLMLFGTGLFAAFAGLFANALLGFEARNLNREFLKLESELSRTSKQIEHEEVQIEHLLDQLDHATHHLRHRLKDKNK